MLDKLLLSFLKKRLFVSAQSGSVGRGARAFMAAACKLRPRWWLRDASNPFPDSETTSSRKRQLGRHFGTSVEEQQQRCVHTFLEPNDMIPNLRLPDTDSNQKIHMSAGMAQKLHHTSAAPCVSTGWSSNTPRGSLC